MKNPSKSPISPTTLFSLHLWCEEHDGDQPEWRGKITNLHSREVRYFRDPVTLYAALLRMVDQYSEEADQLITL